MQLELQLRSLLRSNAGMDQAELAESLRRQGIVVSQSTLSRQLKRMGYIKRDGLWRSLGGEQGGDRLVSASVLPVPPNLLVLKTQAGFANAVAVALDREPLPGQAGTVAGDDTVFVAVGGNLADAVAAARSRFEP